MRRIVFALVFAFSILALTFGVQAQEEKEGKKVTLKGTITCAKCDLKLQKSCATVIKVKDRVYYFDAKAGKKYHGEICTEPKEGQVTGTVSKEDKKLLIKVEELKFKE